MNKSAVMLFMTVGSTIGGYLPLYWGYSSFSLASIVSGVIGGLFGIWLAVKWFS